MDKNNNIFGKEKVMTRVNLTCRIIYGKYCTNKIKEGVKKWDRKNFSIDHCSFFDPIEEHCGLFSEWVYPSKDGKYFEKCQECVRACKLGSHMDIDDYWKEGNGTEIIDGK